MTIETTDSAFTKPTLRRILRRVRGAILATEAATAAHALADNFCAGPLAAWQGAPPPVIAAFWPHGSEIDVRPLLLRLEAQGYPLALPVVEAGSKILTFRGWHFAMTLAPDAAGLLAPPPDSSVLMPDIVIVPLLAFDASGNRLGYGGGYYDATLRALRAQRTLIAVGVAYAAQEVPLLPVEDYDEVLEAVITETGCLII